MALKPSIEQLLNPAPRPPLLYNYRCQLVSVISGNRLDMIVDPGLDYEPLRLVIQLIFVFRTDDYNRKKIEQWRQETEMEDASRWPYLIHTERIDNSWFGMVFARQSRACINTMLGPN